MYIACPPLYKVNMKGTLKSSERYLFDQRAMDDYIASVPADKRSNIQQQRFMPRRNDAYTVMGNHNGPRETHFKAGERRRRDSS